MRSILLLSWTLHILGLSAQSQTLSDSLVAHFLMDGSPMSLVGGIVPIDTVGSPGFCDDRFGITNAAACFDGSSLWSYGDTLDLDTSDFAIALWCRVDILAAGDVNHDYGIAKGTSFASQPEHSGYSIGFRDLTGSDPVLSAIVGDQNDNVTWLLHTVVYSSWHHAIVNRCGDELAYFLDGSLADSVALLPGTDVSTDTYFAIGASDRRPSNAGITGYLNGAVDEIRIYKGRCLSQAEIDTLAYDLLTVGVPATVESLAMRMSPNPASRSLRIDLPTGHQLTTPIVALNALGQQATLRTSELTMTRDAVRSLTVDVSGLPNGAYFVVVPTESGRSFGRFIKE